MNGSGAADLSEHANTLPLGEPSCRALLRSATQAPHERLHHHSGLSGVQHGTISLRDYRALLGRLYGFYLPFERAIGGDPLRTHWLVQDLAWLGVDATALARIRLCTAIPGYDCSARRLGALYVVEGSALGGRLLCRGLDRLLGASHVDGRRFFAGHGADTGMAWAAVMDRIAATGAEPVGRAAMVCAATETFEVFENWLNGWGAAQ
jgi:heme oxygenase